jgi:hypothetical protein
LHIICTVVIASSSLSSLSPSLPTTSTSSLFLGFPGVGDGPKWTCDIHRLPRIAAERQRETGEAQPDAPPCLVYSVGSAGRYQFEDGLFKEVGNNCEIHIFDPTHFRLGGRAAKNMYFHTWGLKSSYDTSYQPKVGGKFLSLQETLLVLGHQDRTIDILKVDCK